MSRQAKIIVFGLILAYSIYSHQNDSSIIDWASETREANVKESEERKERLKKQKKQNQIDNQTSSSDTKFNLNEDDYLAVPQTGSSPYDSYFGKGVYNETDNYIEVKAPTNTHVVFILINSNTNRRIRNEFIRKGETFKMTKIPYGTYDYMYFTGRNWSNNLTINNGKVKGAFKDYPSFNRNKYQTDQMEFERGYYGGYEIKLVQSVGGNLETQSTSENNFFN